MADIDDAVSRTKYRDRFVSARIVNSNTGVRRGKEKTVLAIEDNESYDALCLLLLVPHEARTCVA